VTPILVRPVREQLEHDRVIRLLEQRWRRKYLVGINQGSETTAFVGQPGSLLYPDVVLASLGRPNKPVIIVEVETGESVNHLEAMAEWMRMAHFKAAFHLYVPTGSVDRARRLCTEHDVSVAEIWTYHPVGDQMRFTQVYKAPESGRAARRRAAPAAPARKATRPAPKARAKGKSQPASKSTGKKSAAARRSTKPAPARKPQPKKAARKPTKTAKRK
jgi:hypothetical protein